MPIGDIDGHLHLYSLLEREKGFEPSTLCLGSRCSTPELLPLVQLAGPVASVASGNFSSTAHSSKSGHNAQGTKPLHLPKSETGQEDRQSGRPLAVIVVVSILYLTRVTTDPIMGVGR